MEIVITHTQAKKLIDLLDDWQKSYGGSCVVEGLIRYEPDETVKWNEQKITINIPDR